MKPSRILSLVIGLAGLSLCASCAKKEDPAPEPVKQPTIRKSAPAPVTSANPTNPFRTPEDDLNLPTEAQTAEGAESSIGTSRPVSQPDTAPSVAISPPTAPANTPKTSATPVKPPKKEDQLDPQ